MKNPNTAVIIALEGVLFDAGHRRNLTPWWNRGIGSKDAVDLERNPERQHEWDKYWEAMKDDKPIVGLCMIVNDLIEQGRTLVFLTNCPSQHDQVLHDLLISNLPAYVEAAAQGRIVLHSRAKGQTFTQAQDHLFALIAERGLNVLLAVVKNTGLVSALRRVYTSALVLNAAGAFNANRMIARNLKIDDYEERDRVTMGTAAEGTD